MRLPPTLTFSTYSMPSFSERRKCRDHGGGSGRHRPDRLRRRGPGAGDGDAYLFLALAAVLVGGTSLVGARGDYWLTVVGALVVTLVTTLLIGHRAGLATQQVLTGMLILLFVSLYGREKRLRDRGRPGASTRTSPCWEPLSSSSTRLPRCRSKLAVTWRIMPTAVRTPVTSSVRWGISATALPVPGCWSPNSWCSPAACQGSSSSACSRRPRALLPDIASCRAPGRAVASFEAGRGVQDPDGLRHVPGPDAPGG